MATSLLGIASVPASAATNDCQAKVTFVSAVPKDGQVTVTFDIKTSCPGSTGRFDYTYQTAQRAGVSTTRTLPSWNAANKQNFQWTDVFSEPSTVTNVKVVPGSIQSSKS
jgi:hypothetical protein